MTWAKIGEWILAMMKSAKELPIKRVLFVAVLLLAYMVFVPPEREVLPGLNECRDKLKPFLGVVFLTASLALVIMCVSSLMTYCYRITRYRGTHAAKEIRSLSPWCQALIRQLYENPRHAQKMALSDANVKLMLTLNFLYNANLGDVNGFECGLCPWVVACLERNKKLRNELPKFKTPFALSNDIFCRGMTGGEL